MAEELNKTEQGKQDRAAEKAARAAATQGRRDSAAAAQDRSEERKGSNADVGSADREASFSAREANAGLTLSGNNTTAGRGQSGPTFSDREAAAGLKNTTSGRGPRNATNPDFPPVGSSNGNEVFESSSINAGGGGGGILEILVCNDETGISELINIFYKP